MNKPTKVFRQALDAHRRDELVEAETHYLRALEQAPDHAEAHHLFGVLAQQTGRPQLALDSMQRAAGLQKNNPILHFNLAGALRDAGQTEQAENHYRQALELRPGFEPAALNLGALLLDEDRVTDAIHCYREAIEANRDSAKLHFNLGVALERAGGVAKAIGAFHRCVTIDAKHAKGWNRLGAALRRKGRAADAVKCYRQAIQIVPTYAAAMSNLGQALHECGRLDESVHAFRGALAIDPEVYETQVNLGAALKAKGLLDESEAAYLRAIQIRAGGFEAFHNLGLLYQDTGRLVEAQQSFDRALEADPDNADVRFQRSLVLLQLGKFREGWREYDQRFSAREGPKPLEVRGRLWDGSPLAGKSILVCAEQGVGDEITFASCIPDLVRGGARCTLSCDPRLEPLFARSLPEVRVIGLQRGREDGESLDDGQFDFHTPAGSLPRYLRTDRAAFGDGDAYLAADPNEVGRWRTRFRSLGPGLKIGISWATGGKPKESRIRSASIAQWSDLLSLPGVHWINLQYGERAEEWNAATGQSSITIHDWDDANKMQDLDDLAARITALDMVISVGNTNVHMAGALGVPTWCLLPCHWGWRWGTSEGRSLWYASVEIWRQPRPGDWTSLFARVCERLDGRVNNVLLTADSRRAHSRFERRS